MDETWENHDIATSILLQRKAIQDDDAEVKDSWEDEDEVVPPPEPEPQTSSVAKDVKKVDKIKMKNKFDKADTSSQIDEKKLSAKELEEIQRTSDLEHFKDALGITDEQKQTFSGFEPSSKEEFKSFCTFLVEQINKHHKKKEYHDFLSELFRTLCVDLDSEHVRRYSKDLSVLATELQKREKENEKQKQKGSKKPAITISKRGMLDDIADAGDGFYGGDDDEDFM